jgi:hypothetical protein
MAAKLLNQLSAIAKAKTMKQKVDLICELPRTLRIAGYVQAQANLAIVGARLRLTHKHDNDWETAEQDEWDAVYRACEPWWAAAKACEYQAMGSIPFDMLIGCITRGEEVGATPFTRYRLTFVRPCIKYEYRYDKKLDVLRRAALVRLRNNDDHLQPDKAIIEVCHDRPVTGRPASWYDFEEIKRD